MPNGSCSLFGSIWPDARSALRKAPSLEDVFIILQFAKTITTTTAASKMNLSICIVLAAVATTTTNGQEVLDGVQGNLLAAGTALEILDILRLELGLSVLGNSDIRALRSLQADPALVLN